MRWILTLLWGAALFVFTCSVNFHLLIRYQVIDFQFNSNPDWTELLSMDFQWSSSEWILKKIGHFLGFFVLALLSSNLGKYKSAFWWSVFYAITTEILQLFFFRGGRIYDVVNDSLGVLLAYGICVLFHRGRVSSWER